jgi:hypothetical protein
MPSNQGFLKSNFCPSPPKKQKIEKSEENRRIYTQMTNGPLVQEISQFQNQFEFKFKNKSRRARGQGILETLGQIFLKMTTQLRF